MPYALRSGRFQPVCRERHRETGHYEDACLVVPEEAGMGIEVDEEIRYRGTRLERLLARD